MLLLRGVMRNILLGALTALSVPVASLRAQCGYGGDYSGDCVALELRSVQQAAFVGQIVEFDLYAFSSNEFAQPVQGLEVILDWDRTALRLVGNADPSNRFDPCPESECGERSTEPVMYNWAGSCFPNDTRLDGLNAGCAPGRCCLGSIIRPPDNDGDALYQAWIRLASEEDEAPAAYVPAEGLAVTIFRFETLRVGDTEVALAGSCEEVYPAGMNCYAQTRVLGGNALGEVVTGPIGPPARVTVMACEPPIVVAEGPRYLTITPQVWDVSVALLVSGVDSEVSCMEGFVQGDGTLGSHPFYLPPGPDGWGTIRVRDGDLVAGMTYGIQTDCDASSPGTEVSAPVETTLWMMGDADNDHGVDVFDMMRVLDGFRGEFRRVPCLTDVDCGAVPPHFSCDREVNRCVWVTMQNVDMIGSAGCMPDRVVTILDATATVAAFQGQPNLCPGPCH